MTKILITTIPFGDPQPKPLDMLKTAGIEYVINPFNKKITEDDLKKIIAEYDGLIAGTETISKEVIDLGKKLKIIARVGVGTDVFDYHAPARHHRHYRDDERPCHYRPSSGLPNSPKRY